MTETIVAASERVGHYLDAEGRLAQWPAKRSRQLLALQYIADHLEGGRGYSETELNYKLCLLHTWNDPAALRRYMVEAGILDRKADGSAYWLVARLA